MRVLNSDGFAVFIYDDEHAPPHCHVIFSNGDQLVIGLPLLDVWFGKSIKKKVRKCLEANLDLLLDIWDKKHPNKN